MVYLKVPVGNNAHEDTQHNILCTKHSEYHQEMAQSKTTRQPKALRGRDKEP